MKRRGQREARSLSLLLYILLSSMAVRCEAQTLHLQVQEQISDEAARLLRRARGTITQAEGSRSEQVWKLPGGQETQSHSLLAQNQRVKGSIALGSLLLTALEQSSNAAG